MNGETIIITIEAQPHDVPAELRFRRLLKFASRSLRLKCLDVRQAEPGDDAKDETGCAAKCAASPVDNAKVPANRERIESC